MYESNASTTALRFPAPGSTGLGMLLSEARAFFSAIAGAGGLISEVETMGKLLARAQRVESTDPSLAAALRRQAARACR